MLTEFVQNKELGVNFLVCGSEITVLGLTTSLDGQLIFD